LGDDEGVVLHVHDGLDGVDDPEVDDRIDANADVVLGDTSWAGTLMVI
jgi:hypothetical protein